MDDEINLVKESESNNEHELQNTKKKMERAPSPPRADFMERRYLLLALPLVISCCVYFATRSDSTSRATPTLIKAFVTFRHGSRAPMWTYANDIYNINDSNIWPEGAEKLTTRGKLEAYELGKRLRERYGDFLGEFYKSGELTGYCTLIERTMMSGQLVLSSLFPPTGYQLWNEHLNWQPIPLYPEYIFNSSVGARCATYKVELIKALENNHKSFNPEILETISKVTNHAGETNVLPFVAFGKVWDTTYFQEREGLPLPEWMKTLYPEKLSPIALKCILAFVNGSEVLKKLVSYNYAVAVRDFFLSEDQRKMEIHSWHDLNNLALMTTLGLAIDRYPEPTSCIAIEMHQRSDQKFIEVYYYDSYQSTEPRLLEMPCGMSCAVEELENLVDQYRLENYTEVCQSGKLIDPLTKLFNNILL